MVHDIDRHVAETLGWKEFFTRTDWYDDPYIGPYEVEQLYATPPKSYIPTEQLYHDKLVPRYSTDMNAAIDLLELMPMGAVGLLEDQKTWFCNAYMDGVGTLTDEESDTPAMAICKAWLVYHAERYTTS